MYGKTQTAKERKYTGTLYIKHKRSPLTHFTLDGHPKPLQGANTICGTHWVPRGQRVYFNKPVLQLYPMC